MPYNDWQGQISRIALFLFTAMMVTGLVFAPIDWTNVARIAFRVFLTVIVVITVATVIFAIAALVAGRRHHHEERRRVQMKTP